MTNLQELIETANRLSQRLSQAAAEEKRFSDDICQRLEMLSWEFLKSANDLNEIKYYIG